MIRADGPSSSPSGSTCNGSFHPVAVSRVEMATGFFFYELCMTKSRINHLACALILLVSLNSVPVLATARDYPTVEEILKRHAESIGSTSDRETAVSSVAIGTSEFILNLPSFHSQGKVLFASNADNTMLLSSFDLPEYPYEKIGWFRRKIEIPFIQPGSRSPIGSYLLLNDNLLSERLFGGAICSTWRLLDKNAGERIRFGGVKRINGEETFVLRFNVKSASAGDSGIDIYIHTKTFRHIRTEYRQKIPTMNIYQTGIFANQTGENVNKLVEEFDDFRSADGLMLPHLYKISLVLDSRADTKEFRWIFKFNEYRFGQNFGEDFFTFNKK